MTTERPPSPLRHTERFRVEYAETDMGGAAHATCALLWSERAEHALLRSLGMATPVLTRRRVEIDYLAPLRYGDEIDIEIVVAATGATSVTFDWTGTHDGTMCLRGRTVTVTMIDGQRSPVPTVLASSD